MDMMTSSNGNIFGITGSLCGDLTGHRKGQWRGALMFSFICAWMNGWINNRKASDLWRHRAHYDVTVMENASSTQPQQITTQRDTHHVNNTMRCRFNAVKFLRNPHKRRPIARRDTHVWYGVSFVSITFIYSLLQSLLCYVHYHAISYNIGPLYNGTWLYMGRRVQLKYLYII